MIVDEFFEKNKFFHSSEMDPFLAEHGRGDPATRRSLVAYYRKRGRLILIKHSMYAVVPKGQDPESFILDPYVIASNITDNAVLAYHSALELQGKAYSSYKTISYMSTRKVQTMTFRGYKYICECPGRQLQDEESYMFGVARRMHSGSEILVTNLERTLVDVLHKPAKAGTFEEIWRSLESIDSFDLDQVIEYIRILGNATTAAKVGFYLETHRDALMVDESTLNTLRKMAPKKPHYMIRDRLGRVSYLKDWNLLVPYMIMNKRWEETT